MEKYSVKMAVILFRIDRILKKENIVYIQVDPLGVVYLDGGPLRVDVVLSCSKVIASATPPGNGH